MILAGMIALLTLAVIGLTLHAFRVARQLKYNRKANDAMRRAIHRAGLPVCWETPRRWHNVACFVDQFSAIYNGACSLLIVPVISHGPVQAGDGITLREWSRDQGCCTGRIIRIAIVHYIVDYDGLQEGYAALSIRLIIPNKEF